MSSENTPSENMFSEPDEPVFEQKYWRRFNYQAVIHHKGLTPLLHDYGLHTEVRGDPVLASTQRKIIHGKSREKKLIRIMKIINDFCTRSTVDKVTCDNAAIIARKLHERRVFAKHDLLALAAIYAAVLESCYPMMVFEEYAEVLGYEVDYKLYKRIKKLLTSGGFSAACREPSKAHERILNYVANKLRLSSEERALAMRIALKYRCEAGIRGCALAHIYTALKLLDKPVTEQYVADVLGMSEATVRTNMRRLGIVVEYYMCLDKRCENKILLHRWSVGSDTFGLKRPSEVAYANGLTLSNYYIEVDKPIRVYIWGE